MLCFYFKELQLLLSMHFFHVLASYPESRPLRSGQRPRPVG